VVGSPVERLLDADLPAMWGKTAEETTAPSTGKESSMHVQIINFRLKDVSEADYKKLCDELAPEYAAVPGLVSKVWLADSAAGSYGGVYLWSDRQAMEDFAKTELFNSVATHPNLADIKSTDFAVLEAPTAVTRGLLEPV
jgi:hypothetical protein